jgi:UDP-N-acetylmuramoyl-L-alanyl-D-glutamate--2,6-diaminopimelate ligase
LTTLLETTEQAAQWLRDRVRGRLLTDSRKVTAGDGFIAWPGAATDGRSFVAGALAGGASACLVEQEGAAPFGFDDERIAAYAGLKSATGPIAAAYFDSPSECLDVVAVTGTNGKTSTAWFLAQALQKLGRRCGVVGTLGIGEPGTMVSNGLTTPDPVLLQEQLRRFVDEGFAACALEASSIGIVERRLDALSIHTAIFTNFTQDHLDFHGSMQAYWDAKRSLFDWGGLKAAVINLDDPKGVELQASLAKTELDVWTVSCGASRTTARLSAHDLTYVDGGLHFTVVEGAQRHPIATRMVGQYNVSNLLGVMGALRAMNFPLAEVVLACTDLVAVPGRMDTLDQPGAPLVVVDYAHTADALEKVLSALRPLAHSRSGQLWCVFGCGGDRDKTKRPVMAATAEQHADRIVLTSDNPRSENPLAIMNEMTAGLKYPPAAHKEADRAAAIAWALGQAHSRDVVLLAGKGHEQFQEIDGTMRPFSDLAHAQAALNARPTLASSRSAA